jgi:hypothetical protein
MDILTVVVIVLVIEAVIYGICCLMCRERHIPGEEEQSTIPHHHSVHHSPRITKVVEPEKKWSPPTDHQSNGHENNIRLICFPSRVSSLRDCE